MFVGSRNSKNSSQNIRNRNKRKTGTGAFFEQGKEILGPMRNLRNRNRDNKSRNRNMDTSSRNKKRMKGNRKELGTETGTGNQ